MQESEKWKWSRSVVSYPQRPHGLQPTRLLRPWDFPGKSTGVGCHRLLPQSGLWRYNLYTVNFILYCTLFTLYCTVLCYSPVTTITINIGNSHITPKRLPIWCSGNRIPLTMQEMQETWVQSLGWKIPWRRAWQPVPVFLPEESHGQRDLADYSPCGC